MTPKSRQNRNTDSMKRQQRLQLQRSNNFWLTKRLVKCTVKL